MISKRTSGLFYSIISLSVVFALFYVRMTELLTTNDGLWAILFMTFIIGNAIAVRKVSSNISVIMTSLILIGVVLLDTFDYTNIAFASLFVIVAIILPIAILISFIADMTYYNSLSDKEKAAIKVAKAYDIPVKPINLEKIIDMTDMIGEKDINTPIDARSVLKRNGETIPYDPNKIKDAIRKVNSEINE